MELFVMLIMCLIPFLLIHLLIQWTERRDMRAAIREADLLMRMQGRRCPRRQAALRKEVDHGEGQ